MLFRPEVGAPEDFESLVNTALFNLELIRQVVIVQQRELSAAGQPEQVVFLNDVDPNEVINTFYEMSLTLIDELQQVLVSPAAKNINLAILKDFIHYIELASTTPDLRHPDALAGKLTVPPLQHAIDLELKLLLIILKFVDMAKIMQEAKVRSGDESTEEIFKTVIAELVIIIRDFGGNFTLYFKHLSDAGIGGQALYGVSSVLVDYIIGIKQLVDPSTLDTTGDLYSNILVIFATAFQLSQILSEMKVEQDRQAAEDASAATLDGAAAASASVATISQPLAGQWSGETAEGTTEERVDQDCTES